jgi:CheY-like chemotaxis protein/HPt (histidine-containing phosphotransfer) domain-containing protein
MNGQVADAVDADGLGGSRSLPGDAAAPCGQRRILVAEDNPMNQKVILRQLMLLGFDADMAGDGREALVRWQQGDYALLLSDLHMPDMDGFELTAAIRAAEQSTSARMPIVALTANAMQGEARRCREAGMDDYLSKPLQLGDLRALLQRWLPVGPASTAIASNGPRVFMDAPVDVRVLEKLIGPDRAANRELQRHFQASATEIAGKLGRHCRDRQSLLASEQAHKLGSAALAVGALGLGARCAEIEIAGKRDDTQALAQLWLLFECEFRAVNDFLDALQRPEPGRAGEGGQAASNLDTAF